MAEKKTSHWLITGARRGIGLELARQALAHGDHVTLLVRPGPLGSGLETLKKENSPETLGILGCDVRDGKSLEQASKKLPGAIDYLINNAGVYLDQDAPFEALRLSQLAETLEVNTMSPIQVTQIFLKHLQRSDRPVLANISSLMGSIADNSTGLSYAYRISKAALNMFTKNFALEFPAITALSIHPGWVQTEMGGPNAPTPAEQAVEGILKVLRNASSKSSGKFFDYKGKEVPW